MLVTEPILKKHSRGGALLESAPPAAARILEIELSQPLPVISALDDITQVHYKRVFCLLRFHSLPLGMLPFQFQSDTLLPEDYAPSIWHAFQHIILRHLEQDGLSSINAIPMGGLPYHDLPRCMAEREHFLAEAPLVSVIVPTHDRPECLATCIDALVKLHYPHYEIIIVDNMPSTQETADLVQKTYQHVANLRYVREDARGVSRARNRGIQDARGEILAFTDDDVVVDTYWLAQCVKAFRQSNKIACVTGYTWPLELDTPAQLWFENVGKIENGEINNRFASRIFDGKTRYQHLYKGTVCGHSANMAARADFLRSIGGFDIALGPGTPALAGEDLAVFLQVIMHNKIVAYEPTAMVRHLHRREYDKLRKQMFGYGVGFIAYLLHMLWQYPVLWIDLLTKTLGAIAYSFLARKPLPHQPTDYPRDLVITKFKGAFYGPIAYIKTRRVIHDLRSNGK